MTRNAFPVAMGEAELQRKSLAMGILADSLQKSLGFQRRRVRFSPFDGHQFDLPSLPVFRSFLITHLCGQVIRNPKLTLADGFPIPFSIFFRFRSRGLHSAGWNTLNFTVPNCSMVTSAVFSHQGQGYTARSRHVLTLCRSWARIFFYRGDFSSRLMRMNVPEAQSRSQ